MFSADEVLMFREGWTDVEDERFLRYLRQHWLLGPSRGPPDLPIVTADGHYSQVGQSQLVDKVGMFSKTIFPSQTFSEDLGNNSKTTGCLHFVTNMQEIFCLLCRY